MNKIEIDDEVLEEMKRHAEPFESHNAVLRRLLLSPSTQPTVPPVQEDGPKGRLDPLLGAGLVQPGDLLRCEQVRRGRKFEARIAANGQITTEKGSYIHPSRALSDLTGSQISGWAFWVHVPTGKTLHALRKQL